MAMTETPGRGLIATESGGSLVEAGAGIAVIVLAIIGLARGGYFMTAIATIVLGVALLAEGGAIAAQFSKLMSTLTGGAAGAMELGGGMTAEILAGGGAIVLGILALIGLKSAILLAAAIIAVGVSLMLTAGAITQLNQIRVQSAGLPEMAERVAQAAVSGAVGTQVLAGIAATVLGILALVTSYSGSLTLVGLLVLGASVTATGTALAGRMLRMFSA